MKNLIVIATMFVAGSALAQPAAPQQNQNFAQRFAETQIQSGAKFPTAPIYKKAPMIAAESAALAPTDKAAASDPKRVEFSDRIAEMQKQSGAKFVAAPFRESASTTALAEKESATGTKVR